MSLDFGLRLYNTAGQRQPLPSHHVIEWDFELLERGGCGTFSLLLAAELDDTTLPALPQPHWRVEWWNGLTPVYRGWVERIDPGIETGAPGYRIDGAGLMTRMDRLLIDEQYARPGGADISHIYAQIADRHLVGTERLGELVTSIEADIGYRIERADLEGTSVREAFDRMAEAAQDLLIWGCDVTSGGYDRLYVRKRATTVSREDYRLRLGRQVTRYQQSDDISDLVNAVRIVGGKLRTPNLTHNPSFEAPEAPGDGREGNLLGNPSFGGTTAWTFAPSAADIRVESTGTPGVYARTGEWCAELAAAAEQVQQTVDIATYAVGTRYRLELHVATRQALGSGVIAVTVEGRDSAGTSTTETLLSTTTTASARTYQEREWQMQIAAAGTRKIRVTVAFSSGDPVLVDDVFLYLSDSVVQDGWESQSRGTATVVLDWAHTDAAYDGLYSVRAVVSGGNPANNADNIRIRPTRDHWSSTREKTAYVVRCWMLTTSALKIRLGLQRQSASGGNDYKFSSEITTAASSAWQKIEATVTTGSDATAIRPVIELRSSGAYLLDAVDVYESGVEERGEFQASDRLERYYRADAAQTTRSDLAMHATDALQVSSAATPWAASEAGHVLRITAGAGWATGDYLIRSISGTYATLDRSPAAAAATGGTGTSGSVVGLSAGAAASISTYGLREERLDIDELTDLLASASYAAGYFNRAAVPIRSSRASLEGIDTLLRFTADDADATPQGLVAIGGAGVAISNQHPARISYSARDGELRCDMDLGTRRPTPALLLRRALDNRRGSENSSSGARPGNSVAGGDEGTAPTWRANSVDVAARGRLDVIAGAGISVAGVDDGTDDAVEVTISATRALIAVWGTSDLTTIGTTDTLASNVLQVAAAALAQPVPAAGTLSGLTLAVTPTPAAGQDVTATVYINGAASALAVTVNNGSANGMARATGSIALAATDRLEIYLKKTGAPTGHAVACLWA